MATLPTDPIVHIAQYDTNLPNTGQPNKTTPNSNILQRGYDKNETVFAEHLNYTFDNIAVWQKYFRDSIAEIGSPKSAQSILPGSIPFAPGGGTQFVPADTALHNSDVLNILPSVNGGFEILQSGGYTQFKVSGCIRIAGATQTGVFAGQAVLNGELPISATTPIAIDAKYFPAGDTVVLSFSTLWTNLPLGMDNVIELQASGPDGGTIQGSNQTWLAIEVR